jgi:hypothetical protein
MHVHTLYFRPLQQGQVHRLQKLVKLLIIVLQLRLTLKFNHSAPLLPILVLLILLSNLRHKRQPLPTPTLLPPLHRRMLHRTHTPLPLLPPPHPNLLQPHLAVVGTSTVLPLARSRPRVERRYNLHVGDVATRRQFVPRRSLPPTRLQ